MSNVTHAEHRFRKKPEYGVVDIHLSIDLRKPFKEWRTVARWGLGLVGVVAAGLSPILLSNPNINLPSLEDLIQTDRSLNFPNSISHLPPVEIQNPAFSKR